ncbi:hypothetical protein ACFPM0_34595 [Pseudonocardia sulfidoxydans]|uniref:hypothetical protein n=1 Tax=Pseudonocardia sulfidoxydans TaxID=54011 RepID=UPI00361A4282
MRVDGDVVGPSRDGGTVGVTACSVYVIASSVGSGLAAGYGAGRLQGRGRRAAAGRRTMRAWPGPDRHAPGPGADRPRRRSRDGRPGRRRTGRR